MPATNQFMQEEQIRTSLDAAIARVVNETETTEEETTIHLNIIGALCRFVTQAQFDEVFNQVMAQARQNSLLKEEEEEEEESDD